MLSYKKIRKNDTIKVIAGKNIGKTGKVLQINRDKGRILVEGINFVKKTMR
ncbi:MAG: KOW motif-containing protein, partial [Spirochaetes bacterium]|nr:KOW motif-containing protein [Spirochaetota bacterium]